MIYIIDTIASAFETEQVNEWSFTNVVNLTKHYNVDGKLDAFDTTLWK